MRLLHVADVHLDAPFAGRSERVRRRLRQATREAFSRAVDAAVGEEVDALLIAGDLFDGDRLSFATEGFLLDELGRLGKAGVQVVYATGNHDPGEAGGAVARLRWPEHVRVLTSDEPERVAVPGSGGEPLGFVTGAGHPDRRVTLDLSAAFPRPAGDLPEVALLHTQVRRSRGGEAHEPYAPSDLERLRRAGYDYWALGHVHLRQELSADPPVHYPGSLQGRSPRETGARGGLLVDLSSEAEAGVSFLDLAPVRWETLRVDGLEECAGLERLLRRIEEAWDEERRSDPGPANAEWIVRVALTGPTPLWRELGRDEELRTLADEVERMLGILSAEVRSGGVGPVLDVEAQRERPDVLGEALRLLEAVVAGRERLPGIEVDELAGFRAGGEEDPDAYVRRVLEGSADQLLARMLAEEEDTR